MTPAGSLPEMILRTGTVDARAVLDNAVDLRSYPRRYLTVVSDRGVGGNQVMSAVAAAEVLDRSGWDLVSVCPFGAGHTVYAVMRRR